MGLFNDLPGGEESVEAVMEFEFMGLVPKVGSILVAMLSSEY